MWSARRRITPIAALQGTVANPYVASAVNFNGTTTNLVGTANTAFAGSTDSKMFTVSFWAKMNGGDSTFQIFFEPNGQRGLSIYRDASNRWNVEGRDSAVATVTSLGSSTTYIAGTGWKHILASMDATGFPSGYGRLFINDVDDTISFTQGSANNNNYNNANTINIGQRNGGSLFTNADIADLWIMYGTSIDITVTANRRKFIDSLGKPVDLGATGQLPTGSSPIAFFSGNAASWPTNKGTAATPTFTATALTNSGTHP